MATRSQIGAVISIEGGSQYLKTIKSITQYTKEFESEVKALTSSFNDNYKSIGQLKQQKEALQKVIDSETDKLENQKKMMENINKAASDVKVSDEKWAEAQRTVQTDINNTTASINELRKEMEKLNEENTLTLMVDAWENTSNKTGEALKKIGTDLTKYVTVPVVAGFTAAVKAYTDWESAFNGVRKTVDASEPEFEKLEKMIKDVALETGTSSIELASIAEAGGQLNVPIEYMETFIRTIEALAISTNLSSEEAATDLARIMNITGDTWDEFSKLGDVIVHLGNNSATTEGEIVALANRMASAAHLANFSTPEIFALSAALSSVGISAEAGGSTVGQVLTKMQKQFEYFKSGAENKFDRIAEVAGMAADDFAKAWTEKPAEAFLAFITGLGNMDEESESLILTLDELDMTGIRESNMLKALASAQDEDRDSTQLLTDALKLADEAYRGVTDSGEEFSAMMDEADIRHNESAQQFKKLKESLQQLGDAFGKEIVPYLIPLVEGLTDLIKSLADMDEGTKKSIINTLGLAAAFGPVLTAAGSLIIFIAKLKAAFGVLSGSAGIAGATDATGKLIGASGSAGNTGLLGIGGAIKTTATSILNSLPTIGLVGTVGAGVFQTLDEALDENGKVSKEWEEQWKETFANYDYDTGQFVYSTQEATDQVEEDMSELVSSVTFDVEQYKEQVGYNFREAAKSMTKSIKDETPKVQSTSYQMVKTGIDEIRDAKNSTYGYGQELASNFADGIESKESWVSRAVSKIASIARSYLHFSEPDVGPLSDFHTWMPDMMEGLAKGIEDNLYLVDRAIGDVASTLSGGTNVNYGGVIINLNVPQGANGQQILNEIETELANRTIRRRAVFG